MARRRKAGRPRKPSPRTASGRLSRAYTGPARDAGTPELQAKKLLAVNGAGNPALSASAASILLAHEIIDREQHAAAERYHRFCRRSFGLPDYGPRCWATVAAGHAGQAAGWSARFRKAPTLSCRRSTGEVQTGAAGARGPR
jgi:hypothetical protein